MSRPLPRAPRQIDSVFDDPEIVRALIESHSPYLPVQRYFTNQADDGSSVIDRAMIRYGGSANSGMIYSYQTDLTIQNSVLSNSSTNTCPGTRSGKGRI